MRKAGRYRPVGQGVLDDCRVARGRRVGLPWEQTLCYSLLALIVLWGVGSVVSFTVNRHQMVSVAQQAQQLAQSHAVSDQQLMALQALRNDIGRLQARVAQARRGISALVWTIMRRCLRS